MTGRLTAEPVRSLRLVPDAFEELALAIRRHARATVSAHAVRHERFIVERAHPLRVTRDDGEITLDEHDDDVEMTDAVASASLSVGDIVDVRREAHGFVLVGVIA